MCNSSAFLVARGLAKEGDGQTDKHTLSCMYLWPCSAGAGPELNNFEDSKIYVSHKKSFYSTKHI